ncbi:MAG: hypothetical protein NTW16_10615 [Bacteroidetes bacterium]|nr:hypothetical protein [Bacteroidota bacterium]
MKQTKIYFSLLAVVAAFVITSCGSPVTLTSWKNPADNSKISKVVIMPLFDKLEYVKPFEQSMDAYFTAQGMKVLGSLDILNPDIKYPLADIKKKCDSLGADAILVFVYKGTDKTESYVPPTTYTTGGFGGYWGGGYWGGGSWGGYGGGYYGGAGFDDVNTVTTGGYWTTTSVVNLKASLYTKSLNDAVWTGDITITDPNYVDQSATTIAKDIYADWQKYNLLKYPPVKK